MLILNEVHHTFNPKTVNAVYAIRGISIEIPEGEFATVVGSNGAGKSTLFNLISGKVQSQSGSIHINGENVNNLHEFHRAKLIGRVFQDPFMGTAGSMTIAENLSLAASRGKQLRLRSGIDQELLQDLRTRLAEIGLGLEHRLDAKVALLSGGQRQALTLTMAVLGNPKILLLDEHTASLDPSTADTILELTRQTVEDQGITTLMITHDLNQALNYGQRLLMMDEGRIILDLNESEKRSMTLQKLVSRFSSARERMLGDDRLLLSS